SCLIVMFWGVSSGALDTGYETGGGGNGTAGLGSGGAGQVTGAPGESLQTWTRYLQNGGVWRIGVVPPLTLTTCGAPESGGRQSSAGNKNTRLLMMITT